MNETYRKLYEGIFLDSFNNDLYSFNILILLVLIFYKKNLVITKKT